jgi:hypothetical protein
VLQRACRDAGVETLHISSEDPHEMYDRCLELVSSERLHNLLEDFSNNIHALLFASRDRDIDRDQLLVRSELDKQEETITRLARMVEHLKKKKNKKPILDGENILERRYHHKINDRLVFTIDENMMGKVELIEESDYLHYMGKCISPEDKRILEFSRPEASGIRKLYSLLTKDSKGRLTEYQIPVRKVLNSPTNSPTSRPQ